MNINFANEGLVKISCDCLQHDGHSVNNLIALDKCKRTKGFLADRFIKPPANISLTFKCDIDVSKVVLNTRVGSQKSSGFEILKVYRSKATVGIANGIVDETTERVVFSRGIEEKNAQSVPFCSDRAGERIREMKLKIFRTMGSTLPALGSLEIWGTPSRHVPQHLKNEIDVLWKKICSPTTPEVVPSSSTENQLNRGSSGGSDFFVTSRRVMRVTPEIDVPEEFLDPISCEIMTIPMTLPSGNIVDVLTLEKWNEAELNLGRSRSDPFTGVLFTERNKPVVATSLKSRLDKFLLENSDVASIKTLPRTLGRKSTLPSSSSKTTEAGDACLTAPKMSPASSTKCRPAQSVDQLLVDCLEGLPSYLGEPTPTKKLKMGCGKCNSSATDQTHLYAFKLPCQHIICRNCLCTMKQNHDILCSECLEPFSFDSVDRYHV